MKKFSDLKFGDIIILIDRMTNKKKIYIVNNIPRLYKTNSNILEFEALHSASGETDVFRVNKDKECEETFNGTVYIK